MQSDFRDHPLFQQCEDLARAWLLPGTGSTSTVSAIAASPDGTQAAAAASVCDALEGVPSSRIALIDLKSGDLEIVTRGPHSDSAPQWSPDGRLIAFLSDREQPYVNRLRLFDVVTRTDRATPAVNGFIEYLQWSSDGNTILLGVAGYGSDLAGAQGAMTIALEARDGEQPPWAPSVAGAPEATPWRSVWLYDVARDTVHQVTLQGVNVWQAAWCGSNHVVAVCSDQPEETWWYTANVRLIDIGSGSTRALFQPVDQLGCLAASPSGKTIAVVEAVCSDRNIVAGDVRLIETASGTVKTTALGADVVQLDWRGEDHLLFVAARGPDSIIGLLDPLTATSKELWCARERTPFGIRFPEIAPLGRNPGDALFVRESFFEPPVLLALGDGREREIRRFGSPETSSSVASLGTASDFSWKAPDGLEMHGWLLTPPNEGPHPLIMVVHGGPVWYWRPTYVGRSALNQMLLAAGYALFLPNPRGSCGRGQDFARLVFGDMGGADTYDYLSGLDALQEAGIADPKRIGVTGGSYGGYISSWLITQDQRFAAAVPVAPVTDWVSQHLTCNVPAFCETFLNDRVSNPGGKYFSRSPIHHAGRARTPTLNICGALDKITPLGQALEFHRALLGAGVDSILLTYPREGHGVRNMPAVFDYTARTVAWFSMYMPASEAPKEG